MDLVGKLKAPVRRAGLEARSVAALARAGVIGVEGPSRFAASMRALGDFGPLGAAPRIAALRHADFPAIADERGEITFAEFDDRSTGWPTRCAPRASARARASGSSAATTAPR